MARNNSGETINLRIPKEVFDTGIADAYTFNKAMDWIDALISGVGDGHWKAPVASAAALPLAGNTSGDARITLDTGIIWVWSGVTWEEAAGGALVYQGIWNALTNTPALSSGLGTKGEYYVVGTAGNTNLDGITDWVVGDWAVFNGTVWQKADHTDVVTSVFGRQGPVVAVAGDYDFPKITGTITDLQHGNRGGGALHPVVTPDPGGVAGFMSVADKGKLNGISTTAARETSIQFGRDARVPAGGTLGLFGPGNTLTGARIQRAGTITGASIEVNAVDAARTFDLQVLVNGALATILSLPLNTFGVSTVALAVAVAIGDVISTQMVRTGGAGASTFTDEHAVIEVTH